MINKNAHIIIRKLKTTQTANTNSITSVNNAGLLLITPHNCSHGIVVWLGVVCSSYGTTSRVRWYFFSFQASREKNCQSFLFVWSSRLMVDFLINYSYRRDGIRNFLFDFDLNKEKNKKNIYKILTKNFTLLLIILIKVNHFIIQNFKLKH